MARLETFKVAHWKYTSRTRVGRWFAWLLNKLVPMEIVCTWRDPYPGE